MQDVELVEGDGPDDDAAPDGRLDRRLDRRWWLVLVAVVLAVVLAQQGLDAHHRSVDARYAGVPGVVDRLDPPLRAAWTTSDPLAQSMGSGSVVGDVVVAANLAQDGSTVAVAFDLRTGRRAWTTLLDGADPELLARGQAFSPYGCVSVRRSDGGVPTQVACLSTDEVTIFPSESDATALQVAGTVAHVVVLDAATGEQVTSLSTTPAEGLDVVDGVVVLGHQDGDGRTTVRALDLVTGRVRWSVTTGRPRAEGEDATTSGIGLWSVADEVLVVDEAGLTRLALSDGRVVAPPSPFLGVLWAPDRTRAWLTTQSDDGAIRAVLVSGVGRDVDVPGTAMSGPVDDGSLPGLVLAGADGLDGYDSTTRTRRWTAPVRATSPAIVLEGVVYVATDTGVAAIDGHTGAVRWQASFGDADIARQLFTDGFHVLVATQDVGASDLERGSIVALDERDGHVVWHDPLPGDSGGWVVQVGRALLAEGTETVRLGG